jgi:hypothetical protein
MGRPPLFKRAMTGTERSRRRRAGFAATRVAPKPAEPAPKPPDPRDAEIARLKARVAELEREHGLDRRRRRTGRRTP